MEDGSCSSRYRTIGVGMDYSDSSKAALQWAVDNSITAGISGEGSDQLILIDVQPSSANFPLRNLFLESGAPLNPWNEFLELSSLRQYGLSSPDTEVIDILQGVIDNKNARVYVKVYWGDARPKLCDAVEELKLDSIVVGSCGLGYIKRVLLGSVSNYVVSNATCPVTVVKVYKPDTDS